MRTKLAEKWRENHHLYEAWFWCAAVLPTLLWWREAVLWVAMMSLYANYKTAISAHEGRKARLNTEGSDG